MPDLILCEFQKLKRRKFLIFTILAAILFPVTITILALKNGLGYYWISLSISVYGNFLLLPAVLGILGAMLVFSERENGTQKNLRTIPISVTSLIAAKAIVLLIFSVIYSLAANGAALIGGFMAGEVADVPHKLFMGIVISIMVAVAILPILAIEILSKKGYIFAVILSFVYAVMNFVIVFSMSNIILPLAAVFRWALPRITTGPTYGLDDWFVSSPACIGVLLLTACLSLAVAVIFGNREELS